MISLRPIVLFCLTALASIVLGLSVGSVPISFFNLLGVFSGGDTGVNADIIFGLRMPRVLAGFACGALLALSGVLLQALLRNPLADPFILGVSSGASLAGLLAVILGMSWAVVSGAAFAGAIAVVGAVFALSFRARGWRMENLLLTGVVISAGFGALIILLLTLAPANDVRGMLFWLMGDLSHAGAPWLAVLVLALCAGIAIYFAPSLDVLSLGDAKARSLGLSVTRLQAAIYFCAAAACAAAVMTAGAIGFVGLIAPHAVRLLGITAHRPLIITATLLGGAVVVLADTLARTAIAPQQLPVGVLLALLGVPAMLLLLWKQR
jgi:iron complex transport system permease protein